MRLPDGPRSQLVLIGTSQYEDNHLPNLPAVRHNIEDLKTVLTGSAGAAFPEKNCASAVDVADPGSIWPLLQGAADVAEDLLLVYYAGHGVLDQRGRLYLGLPRTAKKAYHWTSLDMSHIREVMAESGAHNRVLILDCCFSGRAYEAMGG
ncbi:caspase family protein [Nocardia sp. 2YAB30]